MTEKEILETKINEAPIQPKKVEKQLTILKGITTSRVEQAPKGSKTHRQYPYPARVFLKLDCIDCHNTKQLCQALNPKHKKCEECAEQKCRECEILVFFRIRDEKGNWIKPKISKYSYLQVEGNYSQPAKSPRKSFTAYSYQLLDAFSSEAKSVSKPIERRFF
ncbi:MAG: hypothetical protein NY202_05410 [Mollicutes bacterium UO1]